MSSSNLINLMTLIWNLPLNFDVAFCNWLDKFLPPTVTKELLNVMLENVMLELHNVRMKPSNMRKKIREPPNVTKELSYVSKIE